MIERAELQLLEELKLLNLMFKNIKIEYLPGSKKSLHYLKKFKNIN